MYSLAFIAIGFLLGQERPTTYADAFPVAVREGRPIVVFVGMRCREIPGFVSCWEGTWQGDPTNKIVIGSPQYWIADFMPLATDASIGAMVQRWREANRPRQQVQVQEAANCST